MDNSTFNSADKENDAQGKEEAAKLFSEHIPPNLRRPILKEIAPSDTTSASFQDLSITLTEEHKEVVFETVNASAVFDSFMSTNESYDPFSSIIIEGTEPQTRNLEELSIENEDMYYSMEHIVKQSPSPISADESVSEPAVQEERKSEDKMSVPSDLLDTNQAPPVISPPKGAQSPVQSTIEYVKSDMTILADALREVCLDSSYDSVRERRSSNSRQSSETSQIYRNSTFDWGVSFNQNLTHNSDSHVTRRCEPTLPDDSEMKLDASSSTEPPKIATSEQLKHDQDLVKLRTDEAIAKVAEWTTDSEQVFEKNSFSEAQANATFEVNSSALEGEADDSQPALLDMNQESLNESGRKKVFMVNLELRKFEDNESSKSPEIIESARSSGCTTLENSHVLEFTYSSSMSPGTKQVTSEPLSRSPEIAGELKEERSVNLDQSLQSAKELKEDCVSSLEVRKSQLIEANDNLGKQALKVLDQEENDSISLQETTEAASNHRSSLNVTFKSSFAENHSDPRFPVLDHRSVNSEHLEESREVSRPESNIYELTESPTEIVRGNLSNPLENDNPTEEEERSSNDNVTMELSATSSKELFKTEQRNDSLILTQEKQEENTSVEYVNTIYNSESTHKIGDFAEMTTNVCVVNISLSPPLGNVLPSNEDSPDANLSTKLSDKSYKDTSKSDHLNETWNLPQEKLAESLSDQSANATYNSDTKVVCTNSSSEGSALNSRCIADDLAAKITLETSVTRLELDSQTASSIALNAAIVSFSSESMKEVESSEMKNDESSVIYIADDSNSEKALEHLAKSMNQTIDVEVSAIVEDVISVDTSSDSSVTSSSLEKVSLSAEEVKVDNKKSATVGRLSSDKIIDLTKSVSTEDVVEDIVSTEESSTNRDEKTGKDQSLSGDPKEYIHSKNDFTSESFQTSKGAKPQLTIPKKIQCRPNVRTVRNKTRVIPNPLVVKNDTNAEVMESSASKDPLVEQYKKQEEQLSKDLAKLQKELEALQEENMLKDKCILSHALDREANKDKIGRYKDVIQQYEAHLKKQCNDMLALKEESQKLAHDFSSSEMAFADLFRKYERAKEVIKVFKKNEAILVENNEIVTSQIEELKTKRKALKTECDDIIKRAQERVKLETNHNQQKIIRLQNKVKKLKIEASSLDVALKQKTQECAALAALCDDITSK